MDIEIIAEIAQGFEGKLEQSQLLIKAAAAAGAMAYAVKSAMTKKFDMEEAAGYIAANPNKKK